MDEPRRTSEGRPVTWQPGPPPAVPAAPPPPDAGARKARTPLWRRLTRTVRGAAGFGIGAAALLLWPFSEWSALPWLAGLGVLVLLALLRLDRLLGGWVWHLAGLVVVGGLMFSTSPWAWALAASIGVLVAGLLQLPAWRVAAVGLVLCLLSGVAFVFANVRSAEAERVANDLAGQPSQDQIVGENAGLILHRLLQAVQENDSELLCLLLNDRAEAALAGGTGTPSCTDAVTVLYDRIATAEPVQPDPTPARRREDRPEVVIDACDTRWAAVAGDQLGRIRLVIVDADASTYTVDGFAPCP